MVVGKSRGGGVVKNTLKTVILYHLTNITLLSVQRKLVGDSAFFTGYSVLFITWPTDSEIVRGIQITKKLLSVLLIKNLTGYLKMTLASTR